ncbi:SDR family NAD(P)-dependent oxidoreductase [Mucilaginibacter sp. FT3.2]|uniref:SDR family NAD(P)-dependent oxidoreductase n=1 Tax=Mucilaginibacter sp. FT3.2 TaxID=2723090 RepID=UPI00160DE757|nr:SDR family oxidoreductase [Mucilaginibacter sp. FT3.2]MBB6231363.1 glucose 1-dehydrogenase [Mucilaginibacter sp. FT3.2]
MITKRLIGKTALVTGAESGIGEAIAIEFALNGANVVITYLNDETGAQNTLLKVKQAGSDGFIIQADVSKEQNVDFLFAKAIEQFSHIDILVNCAGVRSADKYIHELSFQEFEHTVRTNLFSTFLCCRNFVKHRLQQGGYGRIINITSIHEEIVSPGKTDYCASKSAIRGLCRSLAMELADRQITVNNIAPGMILTPMNQLAIDDLVYRKNLEERIPAKVSGTPLDVAKVALFLASDDATYITGTTQVVDGGLSLNRAQGAR